MAKALITLIDQEDGQINLKAEFWPPIKDVEKMSDAQIAAILMVESLAGTEGVKSADYFREDGTIIEPDAG